MCVTKGKAPPQKAKALFFYKKNKKSKVTAAGTRTRNDGLEGRYDTLSPLQFLHTGAIASIYKLFINFKAVGFPRSKLPKLRLTPKMSTTSRQGTSLDGSFSGGPSSPSKAKAPARSSARSSARASRNSKDAAAVELAPAAEAAPEPQVMERDIEYLMTKKTLRLAQTRRGCVQEILGCEAQTEVRQSHGGLGGVGSWKTK